MIRPVLTELALFLAPFVAYALFLMVTRTSVIDSASWSPKLLASLAIAALMLMIGSFVYLAHFAGSPPNAIYEPAHIDESGHFVPGRTR